MVGTVTISLEGWGQLEDALKTIGPKAARKVGAKAMREAGDLIVETAKQLVPVLTGDLEESITLVPMRTDVKQEIKAHIGFKKPVSARAHFIEFGTSHNAAQPFLRPALDERAADAIAVMGAELWEGIEAEAEHAAGKK